MKGNCVSGRDWKTQQTKRSSSSIACKKGWNRQQQERRNREILQMIKKENLAEAEQAAEAAKAIKAARLARKLENEKKAEVIQKVSAGKLKRMKKKQLRSIKKQ